MTSLPRQTRSKIEQNKKKNQIFSDSDPIVTGSSIIGIRFKNGVMLASDTLGNNGKMQLEKKIRQLQKKKKGGKCLTQTFFFFLPFSFLSK